MIYIFSSRQKILPWVSQSQPHVGCFGLSNTLFKPAFKKHCSPAGPLSQWWKHHPDPHRVHTPVHPPLDWVSPATEPPSVLILHQKIGSLRPTEAVERGEREKVFPTGRVRAVPQILFWPWRSCYVLVTCQPRIEVWRPELSHWRHATFQFLLFYKCSYTHTHTNAQPGSSTSWSDGVPIELWRTSAFMQFMSISSSLFLFMHQWIHVMKFLM